MNEDNLYDPSVFKQIDPICDRFEAAWKNRQSPRIEEYLQESTGPEIRSALLTELLRVELDYRRNQGELPSVAEYRERFPDDTAAVDSAFGESNQSRPDRPPGPRFPIRLNCPHCKNPIATKVMVRAEPEIHVEFSLTSSISKERSAEIR